MEIKEIKGYKVFNSDWTCRGFQFEVGKTFKHKGEIYLCGSGFHFCKKASDCFNYYTFDSRNKVAEIVAFDLVETKGDKSVTNKIQIVREISWHELLDLVNSGENCTGFLNSGNSNTGNHNSSDFNSGNHNSGNYNSGSYNSGNYNSGNYNNGWYNSGHYNNGWYNSGDYNSGRRNSGRFNSGNYNSGCYNSGNYNGGDFNSGNHNSGDFNSGNHNSGDFNSGNHNNGWFSTITPKLTIFEKETSFSRKEILNIKGIKILNQKCKNTLWVYKENMTEEEKEKYPSYKTTGGYLKTISHKEAYKIMWEKLSQREKNEIQKIPNFDARIFQEITGIDVNIEKNNS